MAWEERNGNRYYYRKERVGKTVRSVYVGKGHFAELVEEAFMEAALEKARTKKEQDEWQELEALQRQLKIEIRSLLESHGLHRPSRKPWRRKRVPAPQNSSEEQSKETPKRSSFSKKTPYTSRYSP